MNYLEIYNKLCLRGQTTNIKRVGWGRKEKHHILPKHSGGADTAENITHLYHKEHALAHHLLYKIYHNHYDKLTYNVMHNKAFYNGDYDTINKETGKEQFRQHKGIHAEGTREVSIKMSKKWAKEHPDLCKQRSVRSHFNRTQTDYEKMASTKSRHLIVSPNGKIYTSVAEAAHAENLPRHIVDNNSRRGHKGWSRILKTDRE